MREGDWIHCRADFGIGPPCRSGVSRQQSRSNSESYDAPGQQEQTVTVGGEKAQAAQDLRNPTLPNRRHNSLRHLPPLKPAALAQPD